MHSNAMIALTVKIHNHYNEMPKLLLPIIPICIMILISYIVAKFIEPILKDLIDLEARKKAGTRELIKQQNKAKGKPV